MKNRKIYSVIVSLIPAVQATLDTFNAANINNNMRMYIGAGLILLLIILQGIQIYFNPDIKDKALWVSALALIGYIAGGIIDHLQLFAITNEASSMIRLVFTLVVVFTNAIVKQYNTVDTTLEINLK
jgi:hypothetical protein